MTGGMHGGDLFIIAGRPSMGKTALALNIAQHVALEKKQTVAVFSLEMSKESLLTRMLCSAARVDSQRFRAGYLSQEERRRLNLSLQKLVEAPLYIDDTAGLHLMDMHAKLRRLRSERKQLGLVIVDYLQLMSVRGRSENRNQEVSALSRGLKLLAKELNVPMMVLSQLSRAVESRQGDHRPQLSDLRESGSIEQDADLVGFVFREEVYKRDDESLKGLAELIVAKQRNGPVGTVNLTFLHAQTKFENRSEDLPPEE
jgi:replicative DNA helicase